MRWINLLAASLAVSNLSSYAQQSPTKATGQQMVDAFHSAFGKHPGARAVHAKGIILQGTFTPTPDAAKLTKAKHFQSGTIPVIVRFSDFTGIPNIPDTVGGANPRGLSIKFQLQDGTSSDIVCHSFNGFPVATTDEFRVLLLAIGNSRPGAAKPTDLDKFLGSHPIAKTFLTTQKPSPVSFGTLNYFGVNSFKFTNKEGQSVFIRYQFLPATGEKFLTKAELAKSGTDYLSEEISQRVKTGPIVYEMYAEIAEAGDKVQDPSIAWPSGHKKVLLGTITITKLADNSVAADKRLQFIPNNISDGIDFADQMLNDRAAAYPVSFGERQQ